MRYAHLRRRMFVRLAIVGAAMGPWSGASASTGGPVEPVDSAGTFAEVIAQRLVPFADGEYHWRVAPAAISQTPTIVELGTPSFLLAGGSTAVLVAVLDGPGWRLADGEAVFHPGGATAEVVALGSGAASLTTISLEQGSDPAAFTPDAGVRDVDLVRGSLGVEGSLTIQAEVAAFVLVTAGQVEAGDITIASGSTATLLGDTTLTNNAAEPATVVVAVIGPAIESVAPAPESPEVPPDSASSPDPTSATSPTTTIDPMAADVDGDGLSGADEDLRGTNPTQADSDGDGLDDGFEVFESGTNPLDADSDLDGLNDRAELQDVGTNPSDDDSDDDGTTDGDEFRAGTDPLDPNSPP